MTEPKQISWDVHRHDGQRIRPKNGCCFSGRVVVHVPWPQVDTAKTKSEACLRVFVKISTLEEKP